MGYVTDRKARLQTRLTRVQAALENLYSTFDSLSGSTVKSYEFDSGEGRQKTTRQDISKIQDQIRELEATEDHIVNELNCMGLVSIRLRRNG